MPLAAGSRLGPYEVLGPLGAGGMGEVYRARDTRIGREVAVKLLPAAFAEDRDRLQRFEREARAAGSLNHPNVLSLFDVGTHGETPYLVTELLEGATLRARLSEAGLPFRKAVDYGAQIARGLAAAHEKGIVHRDLKPENVFVTNDGRVKILDFGLARQTGIAVGSATFAATAPVSTDQRDLTDLYLIEGLKEADVNAPQSPVAVVAGTPFFTASLIASANVSSSSSVV